MINITETKLEIFALAADERREPLGKMWAELKAALEPLGAVHCGDVLGARGPLIGPLINYYFKKIN